MKGLKIVLGALCCTALCSCFKDEPLNSECDVEQAYIHADNPTALFFNVNDTLVNVLTTERNIKFKVLPGADLTALTPHFRVTEGATVRAADGSAVDAPRDFSGGKSVAYTVTSQDGQWTKTYTVNIVNNATPSDFHFDDVRYYEYGGEPLFQIFYETVAGQTIDWGSGNAGAMITLMASNPSYSDYPTSQADGGVSGKCAKLTTISTGELGKMFGAPIAAGNLFLGSFEVNMMDMPASTHFGIPLRNTAPVSLTGYYKYQPGKAFIKLNDAKDNVVEVPGRTDDFAIYAIVYEVTADAPYVDGNNSLTSPNIVLKAELKAEDHKTGSEWVKFDIPFEPQNGKVIDEQKLLDGRYNIAIIMSSSADGAKFEGAVGSTLYVDELHISYE